jgi:hypothetical protein
MEGQFRDRRCRAVLIAALGCFLGVLRPPMLLADCQPPAGTYEYSLEWDPPLPRGCPDEEATLTVRLKSTEPVQGVGVAIYFYPLYYDGNYKNHRILVRSISPGKNIPEEWTKVSGHCDSSDEVLLGFLAAPISQQAMVKIDPGDAIEVLKVTFSSTLIPENAEVRIKFLDGLCNESSYGNHVVIADCDVTPKFNYNSPYLYTPIFMSTCFFLRGDCNNNGLVAGYTGDILFLLSHLFAGGRAPDCEAACDANNDGDVNMSDVVYLAEWTFQSGLPPGPPYPGCGPDPTPDTPPLGCLYPICP